MFVIAYISFLREILNSKWFIFIEVKFPCHIIIYFGIVECMLSKAEAFNAFMMLCIHHFYFVPCIFFSTRGTSLSSCFELSPKPSPWQHSICILSLWIYLFRKFYINEIIQYVSSICRFHSLNILKFTHIVWSILHSFLWLIILLFVYTVIYLSILQLMDIVLLLPCSFHECCCCEKVCPCFSLSISF